MQLQTCGHASIFSIYTRIHVHCLSLTPLSAQVFAPLKKLFEKLNIQIILYLLNHTCILVHVGLCGSFLNLTPGIYAPKRSDLFCALQQKCYTGSNAIGREPVHVCKFFRNAGYKSSLKNSSFR